MGEPMHDTWRDYATDLALDVKACHDRINELEKKLAAAKDARDHYKLEWLKERAHVAAIRNEQRDAGQLVVPLGDSELGYECPACCAAVEHAFDQLYCAQCGVRFDWSTPNEYWGDEHAVDAIIERGAAACS